MEVRNKYDLLSLETDEQGKETKKPVEQKWQRVKESIKFANESAPELYKKAKKAWITDGFLGKIDERKKAKNTPAYSAKNKEVQKLCKQEKDERFNENVTRTISH